MRVDGRAFVLGANAIIFLTLAMLGYGLSMHLERQAEACPDPTTSFCERSRVAGSTSLTVSIVLGTAAGILTLLAAWAHRVRRIPPTP